MSKNRVKDKIINMLQMYEEDDGRLSGDDLQEIIEYAQNIKIDKRKLIIGGDEMPSVDERTQEFASMLLSQFGHGVAPFKIVETAAMYYRQLVRENAQLMQAINQMGNVYNQIDFKNAVVNQISSVIHPSIKEATPEQPYTGIYLHFYDGSESLAEGLGRINPGKTRDEVIAELKPRIVMEFAGIPSVDMFPELRTLGITETQFSYALMQLHGLWADKGDALRKAYTDKRNDVFQSLWDYLCDEGKVSKYDTGERKRIRDLFNAAIESAFVSLNERVQRNKMNVEEVQEDIEEMRKIFSQSTAQN